MGTEGSVLGPKSIVFICFNYVKSRLVFVHGIQNDLKERKQHEYIYHYRIRRFSVFMPQVKSAEDLFIFMFLNGWKETEGNQMQHW